MHYFLGTPFLIMQINLMLQISKENFMKIKFTLLLIHLPIGESICYLSPLIT